MGAVALSRVSSVHGVGGVVVGQSLSTSLKLPFCGMR